MLSRTLQFLRWFMLLPTIIFLVWEIWPDSGAVVTAAGFVPGVFIILPLWTAVMRRNRSAGMAFLAGYVSYYLFIATDLFFIDIGLSSTTPILFFSGGVYLLSLIELIFHRSPQTSPKREGQSTN